MFLIKFLCNKTYVFCISDVHFFGINVGFCWKYEQWVGNSEPGTVDIEQWVLDSGWQPLDRVVDTWNCPLDSGQRVADGTLLFSCPLGKILTRPVHCRAVINERGLTIFNALLHVFPDVLNSIPQTWHSQLYTCNYSCEKPHWSQCI